MNAKLVPTYDLYGERRSERPDFRVHCETIAARSSVNRWEIGLHRHDTFFQFVYIRTGSGDALFGDAVHPLVSPCVVLMPPGVSHGYRFSRDVEGFVVTAMAAQFRATADAARQSGGGLDTPRIVMLGSDDHAYVDATMQRISDEFEQRRTGGDELLQAHITTVLLMLGRYGSKEPGKAPADARISRLEALKELIARHYRHQLPAAQYARLLGLSPTHLNRIVRETAGTTTHGLIMERVIDEACRALVFTPASVRQIADGLGFADPGYFSRCFRRRTGQTPGDYRRSGRNKALVDGLSRDNGNGGAREHG